MGNSVKALIVPLLLATGLLNAQTAEPRTTFRVKYVAKESIYLDGGSEDGLSEGMKLTLERAKEGEALLNARTIGEATVIAVASGSAACRVESADVAIQKGDLARFSAQDTETLRYLTSSENSRKYAQVVTFTEDDPLEAELRAEIPRPPLPEINRMRGRIGFEHSAIQDHSGSGYRSYQNGLSVRVEMTRLGGTYWNFTGYWRGRMNSRYVPGQLETLSDLLNRTYHIGLYYNNPDSPYQIGVGRLLLPWAGSLSTLDGGYFARRLTPSATIGVFGGSTPDPTSWNYAPDRRILGVFSSFEKGSYDRVLYNGTAGIAQTRRLGRPERDFAFFENTLFLGRGLSVYHNLEADYEREGRLGADSTGAVVTRSFVSLRLRPHRGISFDLNHNYFRNTPSFDARLVGTGLVDRFLFQGFSGGVRFELPAQSAIYANLGKSQRQGDERASWNYLYGFTLGHLPWVDVRADFRTSRFNSSFGSGSYDSISLTRQIADTLRFELQMGQQELHSPFTDQSRARFVNTTLDWLLGLHYVLGGGVVFYRGDIQAYDQFFFNLGYRF